MMAAELRSPHQRRSDHLSILTRRQPPPQSPGRFAKTFTEPAAYAVPTFDPAFDSDADTEGPASGSSIWRRDFARVVSTSSAASAAGPVSTSLDRADFAAAVAAAAASGHLDAVAPAPQPSAPHLPEHPVEHLSPPPDNPAEPLSHPRHSLSTDPAARDDQHDDDDIDDIDDGVEIFPRQRARSFYGRSHEDDDTLDLPDPSESDRLGPLSRAELRQVLDDDYDLFFTPPAGKPASHSKEPSPAAITPAPAAPTTDVDAASPAARTDSTAPASPIIEPDAGSPSPWRARSAPVSDVSRPVLERHRSADSCRKSALEVSSLASTEQPSVSRAVRSYRVFSESENLTVSILSDGSDTSRSTDEDGLPLTNAELTTLLRGAVERPRLSSGAVPLFVEEIGRIPRAAIVNGKVQRVKVNKAGGSSLRNGKEQSLKGCSVRSLSKCLSRKTDDQQKAAKKRRKSKRRRKNNSSAAVSQASRRRSLWPKISNL